jgi:hypothetical protein
LSLKRELQRNTSIELTYLATRALRLPVQTQLNGKTIFEAGFPGLPTYLTTADIPATVPANSPTLAEALSLRGLRFASDGFLSQITSYPAVGSSRYHGGSIDVNRRLYQGLLFRVNYTLSRAQDNATNDFFTSVVNPRRAEDAFSLKREWGRSALDVHQKFALVWMYEFPRVDWQNTFVNLLLQGWEWNGSYLWQGGQPITVQSNADSNGNLDSAGDRVIVNPQGLPRTGTATSRICRDPNSGTTIIDKQCPNQRTIGYVADNPNARYVQAQLGSRTNVGRNTENSEPQNVWNMAFFKNVVLSENKRLQLQFVAFNIFNHRNFTLAPPSIFGVSGNALSASYANVVSPQFLDEKQFSGGGRILQLGLRLAF